MLKVGSTVRVILDDGLFAGRVGKVIAVSDTNKTFQVELSDEAFDGQAYWFFERELELTGSKPTSAQTEYIKAKDELLLRLEDAGEKVLREGLNRLSTWLDKIEPKR